MIALGRRSFNERGEDKKKEKKKKAKSREEGGEAGALAGEERVGEVSRKEGREKQMVTAVAGGGAAGPWCVS